MSLLAAYLSTLGSFSSISDPIIQLEPFYFIQDFIFFGSQFTSAQAGFSLFGDSRIEAFTSTFGDQFLGNWIDPSSAAPGSYEVRLRNLEGPPISGPEPNLWVPLSESAAWYLSQNGTGSSTSKFIIDIRLGEAILSSSDVTLQIIINALDIRPGLIP